jgi:hypothetical protein
VSFNLVRIGWPNTAAILALAIMPLLVLTAAPDRRPPSVAVLAGATQDTIPQ